MKLEGKKAEVFHKDMEDRIIQDIREMDSDGLQYLIEHMYPVHAEFDNDCETIIITIDEQEAPGADLEDIF